MLINTNASIACLCCMLPSANDYTFHLLDAATVKLAIK